MSATDPNPSNNPSITGQEAWFNKDVRVFEDLYVYGNLYYNFEGTDSLNLDNLNVSGIATFKDIVITGQIDATDLSIRNLFSSGISTFTEIVLPELDNLQVGILTVSDFFRISDGTNEFLTAPATGVRAGNVGINSTLPDQKLDIGGSIHIDEQIFDSDNTSGNVGNYLSKDAGGIRWVSAPPGSTVDGFFAQNEGVNIGVTSFTTINLIGNRSGGDIVFGTDAGSRILDIDIRSRWVETGAGIHTTANVGINIVNPTKPLDVDGSARIRSDLDVDGILYANSQLDVDGIVIFRNTLEVQNNATFDQNIDVDGLSSLDDLIVDGTVNISGPTFIGNDVIITGFTTGTISTSILATEASRAGFATFSDFSGIATFANIAGVATISGFSTNSHRAGFATFSDLAGISTFATQSGFALTAGLSTNTNFIDVDSTDANSSHPITFIDSTNTGTFHKLKIDASGGLLFNPFDNLLSVGEVSIAGILTVGGATTVYSTLDVNQKTTLKNELEVDGAAVFDNSVELNSTLIDVNGSVAAGKTDYRLSSVGTGVSWRPPGVETTNILYVTKDGNDANSGLLEGDAKATIGGAAAVALDGDTIYVRPGVYFENNPVGLRTDVSISGQDLRLVTIVPNNVNDDIFHVRRGCLVENVNFAASNFGVLHEGCGCLAFPPIQADIDAGDATATRSGYIGPGPANEGPSGRWRSPYARNCTNFITGSIGLKIDGRYANAAYSGTNNLGQDLRSMVCDSFTQYNEAGIGVSVTNKAYAQLVSIFTINSHIGIFAGGGGQCDLTNSNSSFGDFGLVADGTSLAEFTGITTGGATAESDVFQFLNVKDVDNNVRKPFDGQSLFFKINLSDYPEVAGYSGILTQPMRTIRSIKVTNGGSGYSAASPPNVLVTSPAGPEAILAELSANVSAAGTISSVDVIASGRNFLPIQPIEVSFSGSGGATGIAVTDPILFTVDDATEPVQSGTNAGLTTVTFNEFVPYSVAQGVDVEFLRISRIITSSHSFEYVGAGTDINRANPFQGGEPIPENEIVAINGGQVPFTSTDQKGNFRIGSGLEINQTTSTISGRDFNRAIQANLTPLILALGG
jgi:cytoskeletal protein CcmA (bactofilin family)